MASTPETPAVPGTISEAITALRALGYVDDLDIRDRQLTCRRTDGCHELATATIDHQFRFEGDSDPGDASLVLGVTVPDADLRGVLVTAYGVDMPPEVADFLRNF